MYEHCTTAPLLSCLTDSALSGAGVPFLPQSPRQSILTGNPEDARSVIARMHGIPIDDPLVQAYIDEITEKIEEEKHSGASYLDCFNFCNDLKTGQRTLIGYVHMLNVTTYAKT